ncbi:hypothetical protein QQM41_06275 [Acetobacter sp. AC2005]
MIEDGKCVWKVSWKAEGCRLKLKLNVSLTERLLAINNNPLKKSSLRIHVRKGIFSHPHVLFGMSTTGVKSGESSTDERDSRRGKDGTGICLTRVH